jgi:transcriptional regulator with XRE-family HTH domain
MATSGAKNAALHASGHWRPLKQALSEMTFRYEEIGQRLKAYRLGSGLSADDLAKRIGISRTALYRFEQGELAKIDTLERLAELLGVSIPTLLGVGIEYIPSAVSYFERMRQIEETADQIVSLSGPISFLLASDDFQGTLEEVLLENITSGVANPDRARTDIAQIMQILQERKDIYRRRRPAVVNLMSAFEIERFLDHGFVGRRGLPEDVLVKRRELARAQIAHFVTLIEEQPIGVQIGIVQDTLPHLGFQLFRQPDRKLLVMSPFRLGGEPNVRVGVAMITSAPDAIGLHEEAVNEMWNRSLKGQAAANCLRALLPNESRAVEAGGTVRSANAGAKRKARNLSR